MNKVLLTLLICGMFLVPVYIGSKSCENLADILIDIDKVYLQAMASGNEELTLELKELIDKTVDDNSLICGYAI